MNDLLKKLLAGIPQQNELVDQVGNSPAYEVAPNLNPSIYPSPMAYPERKPTLDFTNEQPDVIQASVPKPTIKPSLPSMPKQELPAPQEEVAPIEKKASLADLLANLPKPESDNELMNKQANANDTIRNILMARAANKIGASIAGVNADEKYGQDFVDLANKDVTDLQARRKSEMEQEDQSFKRKNQVISEQKALFELGDKEKENDPNSDVSKAFREYMASYAKIANVPVAISDKMSMADLQKTTGMLGNIVSAKMAQDAKKENLAMQREAMSADKATKINTKNLDFAERQHDRLIKSDAYKKISTAEEQYTSAMSALKDPSGVKDIDVLYRTVRGFDPNSAVREGEISLAQQGVSLKAQLENQMSKLGNNPRVIPKEFIQQVLKLAEMNRTIAQKQYNRHLSGIKKNALQRGLAESDLDLIDPMLSEPQQQLTPAVDDAKIESFMKKNNIKDKNEAIKILKENGKI